MTNKSPDELHAEALRRSRENTPSMTGAGRFNRKSRKTMPLLSISHKDSMVVQILSTIRDEPMPALARNTEGTVPVVDVLDLETDETGLLIVPAVLRGVLDREEEVIGKKYELVRGDKREGKNYRDVEVWEIE